MGDFLDIIVQQNEERREKFAKMLREDKPIEEVRAAATKHFEDRYEQLMYIIDYAYGTDLEIACAKQQRCKEKIAQIEAAKTAAEIVAIVG